MECTNLSEEFAAAKKELVQYSQEYIDRLAKKEKLPQVSVSTKFFHPTEAAARYMDNTKEIQLSCKTIYLWLKFKPQFMPVFDYVLAHEFSHYKNDATNKLTHNFLLRFAEDRMADDYAEEETGMKDEEFHTKATKLFEEAKKVKPLAKIRVPDRESKALHQLFNKFKAASERCMFNIFCNEKEVLSIVHRRDETIRKILAKHDLNIDEVDFELKVTNKGEYLIVKPLL